MNVHVYIHKYNALKNSLVVYMKVKPGRCRTTLDYSFNIYFFEEFTSGCVSSADLLVQETELCFQNIKK